MFLSKEKRGGKWYEILSHFSLQIVFPLLIFLIFSGMHDEAIDRTSYPWGFYFSRMKPEAIFLPISLPHGQFMEFKGRYGSTSYISLVGTFFFLLIVYRFLRNTLRRDSNMAFRIGESTTFTWIFWGSILCLLLSFGFPFSLGYEKLLNYTGPFRQFRAPGRWVIPFYYIMTITAFYLLWLWYKKSEWKWKPILFFAALLFMAFESIMHIRALPAHFSNRFVMLNDWENEREENSWVKAHDWSKYQAIMPLPFFHVGSENYWLNDRSPADIPAYIVSIKTGLPLNAVMLSRTSISESLLNIDLVYEPYHKYEILDILPSNKPFLILVPKNASLSPNEQDLVSKATLLEKNDKLRLYALEIDSIKSLISDRQEELLVMSEVDSLISEFSIYMDYNEEKEGCFSGELKNPVTFFEGVVIDSGLYTVSFWYEGVEHDLWPRSLFVAELYRSNGEKYHYMQNDLFRAMALRDNSWGLVEFDLNLKEPDTKIVLSVGNKYITGGSIQIDNVLVRRSGKVNVFVDEFGTRINNRELLLEN